MTTCESVAFELSEVECDCVPSEYGRQTCSDAISDGVSDTNIQKFCYVVDLLCYTHTSLWFLALIKVSSRHRSWYHASPAL